MTFQANQVFDASAMKSVVKGLQDSALKGTGSVHREKLTTVENTLYGIEPHHQVDITFVHLSRCWRWEAELPETTRQLVVPVKPMPCDSCKDECFFHDSGRGTECWPVRMQDWPAVQRDEPFDNFPYSYRPDSWEGTHSRIHSR